MAQRSQICGTGDCHDGAASAGSAAIAGFADLSMLSCGAEPGGLNSSRKYYLCSLIHYYNRAWVQREQPRGVFATDLNPLVFGFFVDLFSDVRISGNRSGTLDEDLLNPSTRSIIQQLFELFPLVHWHASSILIRFRARPAV